MEDRFSEIRLLQTRVSRLRAALRQTEMHLSEAVDRLRAAGAGDEEIREVVGERNARALGIRPARQRTPAPAPGNELDAWLGDTR